jgi:hypothetical protein
VHASSVTQHRAVHGGPPSGSSVDLFWIPLGTGAHVVRLSGRMYEALKAFRERRPRRPLYHSALVVSDGVDRFVIEITPIPDDGGDRGVVGTGPVGLRAAGRLRLFRYEIRRWRGGAIPDVEFAVGGPVGLTDDPDAARTILDAVASVPTPVWGRDELGTGEMWNSNSVIAWVLARAGFDPASIRPPAGGRAPGWDAGAIVARRTADVAAASR